MNFSVLALEPRSLVPKVSTTRLGCISATACAMVWWPEYPWNPAQAKVDRLRAVMPTEPMALLAVQ